MNKEQVTKLLLELVLRVDAETNKYQRSTDFDAALANAVDFLLVEYIAEKRKEILK